MVGPLFGRSLGRDDALPLVRRSCDTILSFCGSWIAELHVAACLTRQPEVSISVRLCERVFWSMATWKEMAQMRTSSPLRIAVIALGTGGLVLLFVQPQLGIVLLVGFAMFGGYGYFLDREMQKRRATFEEDKHGNDQVIRNLERDGLLSVAEADELRQRWGRGPDGDIQSVTEWRRSRRIITPLLGIAIVGILYGGMDALTGSQIGLAILVISVILLVGGLISNRGRNPIVDPEYDGAASLRTRKVRVRPPIDADAFDRDLRRVHQRLVEGDISQAEHAERRKRIIYP